MSKKILYFFLFGIAIWLVSFFVLKARPQDEAESNALPTYFCYSKQQLEQLSKQNSSLLMSSDQLKKWDALAPQYLKNPFLSPYEGIRFYTYLYNAQRDVAFISYNVQHQLEGSLDPISEAIFTLFFSTYQRPQDYSTDVFSENLASIVFQNYKARFEKEQSLEHLKYELKPEVAAIPETRYSVGIEVAKWIPWIAKPESVFRAPAPPAPNNIKEWSSQLSQIRKISKNLTNDQIQAIYFWAGQRGANSGDWRIIANSYMNEEETPLEKKLLVRSVLMIGIYDTNIACMHSKYHYSIIRPSARDPSLTTLIKVPEHPSYPSGHSSISKISSAILSYYFPENKNHWEALAEESGLSRIWARIHYPVDHQAGQIMAQKIGIFILTDGECYE